MMWDWRRVPFVFPIAFVVGLMLSANAQQPVTITYIESTSVDPDGGPVTHEWSISPATGATLNPNGRSVAVTYTEAGTYMLTVTVRDQFQAVMDTIEQEVVINLPPTPPVIEGAPEGPIILPPDVIVSVTGSHVMIAADNYPVETEAVQFYIGNQRLGNEDTISPYQTLWDSTAVPDEHYCLHARLRDGNGNLSWSSRCVILSVENDTMPWGSAPYLLTRDSPAIDSVPCLPEVLVDFRGAPRGTRLKEGATEACDVGAVEFQPSDYSLAVVEF